ncbi:unnamed protein product [Orchesella dallaii]|uniref:Uncharacterized protein n=1 Tax=Orchesella dallaii TaxID=48710 RepID=A0ABP1QDT5_9HEXA
MTCNFKFEEKWQVQVRLQESPDGKLRVPGFNGYSLLAGVNNSMFYVQYDNIGLKCPLCPYPGCELDPLPDEVWFCKLHAGESDVITGRGLSCLQNNATRYQLEPLSTNQASIIQIDSSSTDNKVDSLPSDSSLSASSAMPIRMEITSKTFMSNVIAEQPVNEKAFYSSHSKIVTRLQSKHATSSSSDFEYGNNSTRDLRKRITTNKEAATRIVNKRQRYSSSSSD